MIDNAKQLISKIKSVGDDASIIMSDLPVYFQNPLGERRAIKNVILGDGGDTLLIVPESRIRNSKKAEPKTTEEVAEVNPTGAKVCIGSLEEYFRVSLNNNIIDHALRTEIVDGIVKFYIHPSYQDGATVDFLCEVNSLYPYFSPDDLEAQKLKMAEIKRLETEEILRRVSAPISCPNACAEAITHVSLGQAFEMMSRMIRDLDSIGDSQCKCYTRGDVELGNKVGQERSEIERLINKLTRIKVDVPVSVSDRYASHPVSIDPSEF